MSKITDLMDIHLGIALPKEDYFQYKFLTADTRKLEEINFYLGKNIYRPTTKPRKVKQAPDRWEQYLRRKVEMLKFKSYYQLVKWERERQPERIESLKIDWKKVKKRNPVELPNQLTGPRVGWGSDNKRIAAY
jgi:hypothetical protein